MSGIEPRGVSLPRIEYARPCVDQRRASTALAAHFSLLGLEELPVRWVPDAEAGYRVAARTRPGRDRQERLGALESKAKNGVGSDSAYLARAELWPIAWTVFEDRADHIARQAAGREIGRQVLRVGHTAGGGAVRALGWARAHQRAESHTQSAACEGCARAWAPMLEAYAVGLWLFWVLEREVIAVPRPALHATEDELGRYRLHRLDGPAVDWPGGAQYYLWQGIHVPARVVIEPGSLTASQILEEPNVEVQRVMLERFGYDRFLLDRCAVPVQADAFGALYRVSPPARPRVPIAVVHVTNSTPEPDGTRRRYFLRVPPDVRTAHQAVAWTFGMREEQYRPAQET